MAKSIAAYVRQQSPAAISIVAMGQRFLETAPEDILLCLQRDIFDFVLIAKKIDNRISVTLEKTT